MEIKGFIFDFDGVIAASEPFHCQAWLDLGRQQNKPMPPGFLEAGVGRTDLELALELSTRWQHTLAPEWILGEKRRLYQERTKKQCPLIPGVKQTLRRLYKKAPLALATSSSSADIEGILVAHELKDFFKVILTFDHVKDPKPHPEIYQKAAEGLCLAASHCLAFEDSPSGSRSAREAGCKLIALGTTGPFERLEPYVDKMNDFCEIEDLFQRLGLNNFLEAPNA